jgi:hypothetical protein
VAKLSLGERFCGPPASARRLGLRLDRGLLGGGVEVTLRCPPPLGRPLRLPRRTAPPRPAAVRDRYAVDQRSDLALVIP